MASINPQNEKIIQPPKKESGDKNVSAVQIKAALQTKPPVNPFFWPQVIEWSAIAGTILILAGGGFFFVYPMFQKFQTLPKVLENEKKAFDGKLKEYQATSEKLELYRQALANYSSDLDIVVKSFWKNASGEEVRKNFEERGKPYGVLIKSVEENNNAAKSNPNQKIFDVEISGEPTSLSGFKQILEVELPLVRLISETAVSENNINITIALPVEPSGGTGENTVFNADLYSFSKFRIIKESNVDY